MPHFPITRKQREALFEVFQRDNPDAITPRKIAMVTFTDLDLKVYQRVPSTRYRDFRKKVKPTFFCDGSITIPWANMWLCIETNGYTHS